MITATCTADVPTALDVAGSKEAVGEGSLGSGEPEGCAESDGSRYVPLSCVEQTSVTASGTVSWIERVKLTPWEAWTVCTNILYV
jgi:hypothetical protein